MRQSILVDVIGADLSHLDPFDLQFFSAEEMTAQLINWSGWRRFDPDTTLIVFPGNGAQIVRSYLPVGWLRRFTWANCWAKRHWIPGETPVVTAGRIFYDQMCLGVRDVVLIDDVISSGLTSKRVMQANQPWFPGARWHTVAWMGQRARNLRGLISNYTPVEVGSATRKVPINSLSTLLTQPMIAESYAKRNFGSQAPEFLHALNNTRLSTD